MTLVNDRACPACNAPKGTPCTVVLDGVDTTGWSHDARILAPVIADVKQRFRPVSEREGDE